MTAAQYFRMADDILQKIEQGELPENVPDVQTAAQLAVAYGLLSIAVEAGVPQGQRQAKPGDPT